MNYAKTFRKAEKARNEMVLSLLGLTVKMAPTIEYPAQQCEASPKSQAMVVF